MFVFADKQILEDLIAHESKRPVAPPPPVSVPGAYHPLEYEQPPQYSSSSSGGEEEEEEEEEGERAGHIVGGPSTSVSWVGTGGGGFGDVEEFDGESSEDEEYTVKVKIYCNNIGHYFFVCVYI